MPGSKARSRFFSALAALAAANALSRPLHLALQEGDLWGALSQGLALNPAVLSALLLGLGGLARGQDEPPLSDADLGVGLILLLLLLLPSATVSWLVLAVLAGYLCRDRQLTPAQHAGAAILLLCALREPLTSAVLDVLSVPLLALDARLAALLLSAWSPGAHAQGNLILQADEVRLVVLTGCSSLVNLSYALLFWYAASRTLYRRFPRPVWYAGLAVGGTVVALNVLRLVYMANSRAGYLLLHEGVGQYWLSSLSLLLVVGATCGGIWYAEQGRFGRAAALAVRPG